VRRYLGAKFFGLFSPPDLEHWPAPQKERFVLSFQIANQFLRLDVFLHFHGHSSPSAEKVTAISQGCLTFVAQVVRFSRLGFQRALSHSLGIFVFAVRFCLHWGSHVE
jgi:hypothetical protein